MAYLSRQLFFKFACVVVASLVTFAGVLMSMDLLRQMPEKDRSHSSTSLHFFYRMEQFEGCRDCTYYHYSGTNYSACCRRMHNRKWGPAFQLLDHGDFDVKLRMTPAAQRNQPFLRRTRGIDYSEKSNSTNYVYLFPDPIPAPESAPEPSIALPPLFWDDYQQPYYAPWENYSPQITIYPPLTMDYSSEVYPPLTDYGYDVVPPM